MTLSTHLVTSEGRLFLFPFASSHFEETRQERLKTPTTIFRNINSPCHHQPLYEESPIFLKYHRKRPQTTLLTSGNNRVSLRESRSVTTPYSHTHTHTHRHLFTMLLKMGLRVVRMLPQFFFQILLAIHATPQSIGTHITENKRRRNETKKGVARTCWSKYGISGSSVYSQVASNKT